MEDISTKFAAAVNSLIVDSGRGAKSQLARDAGITFNQLYDLLKERRYGSEEQRRAVAKALKWNYEDLLNLGGCICAGQDYYALKNADLNDNSFKVPFLGSASQASTALSAGNGSKDSIVVHPSITNFKTANQIRAFKMDDSGMEPIISCGALVLVDLKYANVNRIKEKTIYLVEFNLDTSECLIRYLERISKNLIELKPANSLMPRIHKKPSELRLIGRIVWACQSFEP